MKKINLAFVLICFLITTSVHAKLILTNEIKFPDAPGWLTNYKVVKCIKKIQNKMEWDVKRVDVRLHATEESFLAAHNLRGASILAVADQKNNMIHFSPKINASNFCEVLTHEFVHIILYQKYKKAIPTWLEEGLANYFSDRGRVDYNWLFSVKPYPDVRKMLHPFKRTVENNLSTEQYIKYHPN